MDMYTEKIGTKKAGQGIIYHATKCLMVGWRTLETCLLNKNILNVKQLESIRGFI